MKITPATRVCILGVALCVALTICAQNFADRGGPYFIASLMLAGIVYLLAVREFFSRPAIPRRVVVIGLVLAAGWHIEFLRVSPGADDDIHRYVWDGRLQRLGYNPYLLAPSNPAAKPLHTAETRKLNNPDLPSPYPAGAELFFRAITAVQESVFALKIAFFVCDWAIVFVLFDLLRRTAQPEHWVLAYAWHPLLAIEATGSGHVDIVGALLLLMSASALVRQRRTSAAVTFGLAVAVKLLPVVLVPLYWKRVRIRDGALAAIVVGTLYIPFLNHGLIPIGSLATYVHSFWFNDPAFAVLEHLAPPEFIAGLAVFLGILTATWFRTRSQASSPEAFAWPMTASLLCAPVVYPWYLLWMLPFLRSASTLPIVVWTISILPTYYVWHLRALGRPFIVPGWIMLLEYGSVALAAALMRLRERRAHQNPGALSD